MSRFIDTGTEERIQALMFGEKAVDAKEQFLREELTRYIPQLSTKTDKEIEDFVNYQRSLYLQGKIPEIGRPIASLNPTFVDSIKSISFASPPELKYIRASRKENGYRIQLHNAADSVSAYTRQFTRYDLNMFPELTETLGKLPVMIGDGELVNRRHIHLAGFNRVQLRIPDQTYWPKAGSTGLDKDALEKYLADPSLFENGQPLKDLELIIVFHGMFAIADPSTWDMPREIQEKNLISLCELPINYKKIDAILDKLAVFISDHRLNARVVERVVATNFEELNSFVERNRENGYEGTCIVQSIWDKDGNIQIAPRSIKVKTYETLDCILHGLYLKKVSDGFTEDNIKGALLGLYDEIHKVYLPALKVNLDPYGVQVKTDGQEERLTALRAELFKMVSPRRTKDAKIYTLYDVFVMEGRYIVNRVLKGEAIKAINISEEADKLPLRNSLKGIFQKYTQGIELYRGGQDSLKTVAGKFISTHLAFMDALYVLVKSEQRRLIAYLSQINEIRLTSAKLVKPQVLVDTKDPIIIEAHVFGVKWGKSPFAAGFHSWYMNSFVFNNCFAERVRHDKSTTTDYYTVHSLARMNTPRKSRKKKVVSV